MKSGGRDHGACGLCCRDIAWLLLQRLPVGGDFGMTFQQVEPSEKRNDVRQLDVRQHRGLAEQKWAGTDGLRHVIQMRVQRSQRVLRGVSPRKAGRITGRATSAKEAST